MLPLLARLYGADATQWPDDRADFGQPARLVLREQGRELDPDVRRAIEQFAEDHAAVYFEKRDRQVERVGQYKLGYDLVCAKPGGATLHVEVKGTRQ